MSSECDVVREWVRAGGSLLLIADHAPFGAAAARLASRFGVTMGQGYVFDVANSDFSPTILIFSAENGLLGDHPAVRGRSESERVRRVVSFQGQSLHGPPGSVSLLTSSPSAYEADTQSDLQLAQHEAGTRSRDSRADRAHALGLDPLTGALVPKCPILHVVVRFRTLIASAEESREAAPGRSNCSLSYYAG